MSKGDRDDVSDGIRAALIFSKSHDEIATFRRIKHLAGKALAVPMTITQNAIRELAGSVATRGANLRTCDKRSPRLPTFERLPLRSTQP